MKIEYLFFELLQVSIGVRQCLSATPSAQEWQKLFDLAMKQSLLGIAFSGVERLPREQWPMQSLILQWYGYVVAIEQQNASAFEVCRLLTQRLQADGFCSCILKGQANLAHYERSLAVRRNCGDIDIWVVPADKSQRHPVCSVLEYLDSRKAILSLCYLHAEVKPVRDVPVEVHLRPSFLNAPLANRRLQQLFADFDTCVAMTDIHSLATLPTLQIRYDIIFQLCHIYRHLIDEGVGLRQVLDYYMLLQAWHRSRPQSADSVVCDIRRMGMMRFARALMYVMRRVFAMPSDYMIVPESEVDGHFLLNEILQAGNFGHYDPRMSPLVVRRGKTAYQLQRAWRRFVRNLRFITSYPDEVFWEPPTRFCHFLWRKYRLWRF